METAFSKMVTESDRLQGFDFAEHNAEVREVWDRFNAGSTLRTPIIVGLNPRFFLMSNQINEPGITFKDYTLSPRLMFEAQLRHQRWSRFNVLQDAELGEPEAWTVSVDFQNFYDSAWLGCEVQFPENEVPDTTPAFRENPQAALDRGIPDPFSGVMATALEFYDQFRVWAADETYYGQPIEVTPPWCGIGTDGVFTAACSLFGAEFVCTTLVEDPETMKSYFEFIAEALISKMSAWRKLCSVPVPSDGFGIVNDSITLISTRMYEKHVLPHDKRMYEALATDKSRAIHLCGDATRHFPLLVKELSIASFDTGFPVDFADLRNKLGTYVVIQGGPHVEVVRTGTPDEVYQESKRILETGILSGGGRFVLREGNNLAPGTPLENTEAMYLAGRRHGYKGDGWQPMPSWMERYLTQ